MNSYFVTWISDPNPIKMQPSSGAGPTPRHMQDPAGWVYSNGQCDNITHICQQLTCRNFYEAIKGAKLQFKAGLYIATPLKGRHLNFLGEFCVNIQGISVVECHVWALVHARRTIESSSEEGSLRHMDFSRIWCSQVNLSNRCVGGFYSSSLRNRPPFRLTSAPLPPARISAITLTWRISQRRYNTRSGSEREREDMTDANMCEGVCS